MWSYLRVGILVLLVLVLDQVIKIYVKTNFVLGESYEIFSWFKILFIENEGAAWGIKIPGSWGKLTLTFFRLFAVVFVAYWLAKLIKRKESQYLILFVALIFSGAIGNIIDSVFYGIIFDESHFEPAVLFAKEPYGSIFMGKVVDMFSLPIIDSQWPDWMPYFGGKPFRFFQYVFNVSDVMITIGGVGLLFSRYQKRTPPNPISPNPKDE